MLPNWDVQKQIVYSVTKKIQMTEISVKHIYIKSNTFSIVMIWEGRWSSNTKYLAEQELNHKASF